MSQGLNPIYQKSIGQLLTATYSELLKWNPRPENEVAEKQGKELAEALFLATPRAKFSDIQAAVKSRGWKFKRPPARYAKKMGPRVYMNSTAPAGYGATITKRAKALGIVKTLAKKAKRAGKKGNLNKQIRLLDRAIRISVKYDKLTLEEAQYAAISYRKSKIGAMASSWIPAMRALGSKMTTARGERRGPKMRPMASATITRLPNKCRVVIENRMPGIAKLADRTRFVDRALLERVKDMEVYIARKKAEVANIFNQQPTR